MRRPPIKVGVLLVLGAVAVALAATTAHAATLTQVGWWWRVNDALIPATVPGPTVPEGGLMVSGAPDGALAIAALHFELDDDETSPVLTLTVAENGDQGGADAVLAACVTGSAWQPEGSGAWANKPYAACDQGSVAGVRAADGTSWSFALAPLLSEGVLDVTLVPGRDPALPPELGGSTFQLVFTAPTAASLTTTRGAGSAPPIDLPAFSGPPTGSFVPPPFGGDDLSFPVAAPTFAPSLPAEDQGLTATAPVVQQRNAPLPASPVDAAEDHTVLAVVIFALCGAALLWGARLRVPAIRRLGGFAPSPDPDGDGDEPLQIAGLGRFARARSGPVPRL